MKPKPNWIQGAPTKKGKYWLCLHDQGGWPFIVIGEIYTRLENAGEIWDKIRILKQDGKIEEAKKYVDDLPLWITIPELCPPCPLSEIWNFEAYEVFEGPELPLWSQDEKDD